MTFLILIMSRFIGDPRQLLHRLETFDHLEPTKKIHAASSATALQKRTEYIVSDALTSPANVNFMARILRSFPPRALARTMGGLLEAPGR